MRPTSSPATTLDLIEHDTLGVAGAVRSGRATVGFCDGPAPPIGLRSEVIGVIELAAVVAPRHVLARSRRSMLRLSQSVENDVIIRRRGSATRDVTEALLAPHGLEPIGRRIEVTSNAAARLAAVNGSGVAIVPAELVASDLAAGRLFQLVVRDLVLEQPVRLVWKGTSPSTAAARSLRHAAQGQRTATRP